MEFEITKIGEDFVIITNNDAKLTINIHRGIISNKKPPITPTVPVVIYDATKDCKIVPYITLAGEKHSVYITEEDKDVEFYMFTMRYEKKHKQYITISEEQITKKEFKIWNAMSK